jgi:hypothetical protein
LATTVPERAPNSWFYGHPAPTVSAAAAFKNWHACIEVAAARLDDHKSSVMDIALAIEPLCDTKEETMIDAINKEFLDKNTGVAANMSVTEMERVRKDARANLTRPWLDRRAVKAREIRASEFLREIDDVGTR